MICFISHFNRKNRGIQEVWAKNSGSGNLSVRQGFGEMVGRNVGVAIKVGDSASYFDDFKVAPSAQVKLLGGSDKECVRVGRKGDVRIDILT